MTRIVAGSAGGRLLRVPPGRAVRPTSDRAREGLFSALQARRLVTGALVLDLWAGSGALGLEALSRGAARALFVERDPRAVAALRANAVATGLAGGVDVLVGDVAQWLRRPAPGRADLAFLDPPYATPAAEVGDALGVLRSGWLADGAVVAVERASREAFAWPDGYRALTALRFGDTTLWLAEAPVAAS